MKPPSFITTLDALRQAAKQEVQHLFKEHQKPYLYYHNQKHTEQVVEKCITIAQHYQLSTLECAILEIAAWFHDTGHLFGPTLGHEEVGVARFLEFIQAFPTNDFPIDRVVACILSTKMPQEPLSFLEAIICDADTYHLGTAEFTRTDALLKQEITERTGTVPQNWEAKTLDLLQTHCYHTFYCHSRLAMSKQKHYEQYLEKASTHLLSKTVGDPSSYPASAGRAC